MEAREFSLGTLRYVLHYPHGFTEEKTYPLIIKLNGAGSRGNDIGVCMDLGAMGQAREKMEEFPFLIAVPLCSADTWFDLWEHLEEFVRRMAALSFVDEKRIYLTGASMGGYATWQLGMSMPEYFAAIAPVCGGGMYWNAGRLVNVPVWAFHGGKDPTVLPRESEKMVESVNKRGGNARLTVYPENGHDAWTDTYTNPELYRWFLSHENKNEIPLAHEYNDPKIYG